MDLRVDPELASASTLSAACYHEPGIYQREQELIFAKTWQPLGRIEQVEKPGDYFTGEVAGEPIVVVRGTDGGLRAFINVCRHRASTVAQGHGNCQALRCPYHGWTYNLQGQVIGTPEFDGVKNWDRAETRLPEVRVETWGPFLFVNLGANGPDLKAWLAQIPEEVSRAGFRIEDYRFLARKDYVIECNWKTYVDNYLEGYHIPVAHPSLFREIDYKQYRVDTFRNHAFQFAPLKPPKQSDRDKRRYDPADGVTDALYYWLFPNFMVNIYPDNLSSNIILPLGPERTLTLFEWFLPPSRLHEGAGPEVLQDTMAFSDQVQQEDITICERVQKGLKSRSYDRGRYSVRRENGVHHFHLLLQEFLR